MMALSMLSIKAVYPDCPSSCTHLMDHHSILAQETTQDINLDAAGAQMYALARDLYPICRSITGDGLRASLRMLQQHIALQLREVPTGTQVFDWTVPNEWNIRDAYVKNAAGDKVIDFAESNLHVVNYSTPIHRRMSLAELREHLHTLPNQPDWIPYRTSYYRETWGFCLRQSTLDTLASRDADGEYPDGEYEVYIDSTLAPGSLTYGELLIPGATQDEVLISCHSCHPSLCNDNLSGMTVGTFLAKQLQALALQHPLRYSYRFLFLPGTIGSITWLAQNEATASRIKHGLVLACVGDAGGFTYKRSRRGEAEIDRVVTHALATSGRAHQVLDFSPYGYDERQYCSPGFNLPVGNLGRTPHGRYPEYHTSADNLDLITPTALGESLQFLLQVVETLEGNHTYLNTNPKCEPQLGKRGLYSSMGGRSDVKQVEMAMLWVLNFCDGDHTLLEIAERSGLAFATIRTAADLLIEHELLVEISK